MKHFLKKLSIVFLFLFCCTYTTVVKAKTSLPEINAQGCALIDVSTGKVLYGKNEKQSFEPASTTKVMTAIVVLEHCALSDEVTVKEDFTSIDGTAIGLLKGDVVTVHDLLLGLLMESGNDCANALACHVSGSIDKFAKLMNEKAIELGATNTNFKNPSGLPDNNHLTTAHDLALFLREAINNKDFIDISTTAYSTITILNNPSKNIVVNNKNYMINKNSKYYYSYALCGKNGYTTKANHTYVACAEKDGHLLIASFLNATDKDQNFFDMKSVFNYGFDNFSFIKLYNKDEQVSDYEINKDLTVPLVMSKDIGYVVPKGSENTLSYDLKIEDKDLSKKSFNQGDNILKGIVYVNDENYLTVDLKSGVSRVYESPLSRISNFNNYNVLLYTILGIGVLVLLFILRLLKLKNKKDKSL